MCFCLCRSFRAVGEKSYFGALTKEKLSDIVVLVTDRRTESEQPKMKKNCYLYTRVSTAAQIEGYSLEAQTEKLRGVCGLQGTGNSRGILRCGEIR